MKRGGFVLVQCKINRGAFSGERVFRMTLASGQMHLGTGCVDHFFLPGGKERLPSGQPRNSMPIAGLVEARVLDIKESQVVIETPDGESSTVDRDQILYRRSYGARYVPVE